jgi:glycosyltransferase involved in cell wall biosynthesis
MKILVLTPQILYPWWHYGRYSMYFLLKKLNEKGLDIYLSFPVKNIQGNKENLKHLNSLGLKTFPFELDTTDKITKLFVNIFEKEPFKINKYYSKKYLDYLIKEVQKIKPDLIQVHSSHMFKLGYNLAKEINYKKIPVILRQQDIVHKQIKSFIKNTKNPLFKIIAYWQYKKTYNYEVEIWNKADRIIFVTRQDYEYFLKINHSFHYKALMIPDGVEIKENLYLKNKTDRVNGICFMASDQIPNIISLRWFLNIWKKIYNKTSFSFHVYGKICKFFEKDKKELEKIKVFLYGFIEDKEELDNTISKYKLFISPTIAGSGYRTKIFDVSSFGMPVLCTEFDYIAVNFIFQKNEDILTFTNDSDLLNILRNIENKQIDLEQISNNVYNKVKLNLSWDRIADMFIEVYNEIIGE